MFPNIPDLRRLRSLRHILFDTLGLVVYIHAPPSLTHLQLCSLGLYPHSVVFPFLSRCPALSHLMFYWDVDREEGLLEEALINLQGEPSYRCIAVVSAKLDAAFIEWWTTFRERDPRLLLVNIGDPRAMDHIMDADEPMLKRFDFWDRVDAFLEGKS